MSRLYEIERVLSLFGQRLQDFNNPELLNGTANELLIANMQDNGRFDNDELDPNLFFQLFDRPAMRERYLNLPEHTRNLIYTGLPHGERQIVADALDQRAAELAEQARLERARRFAKTKKGKKVKPMPRQ